MVKEKVFWKKDGLKISGEVYLPEARSGPFPALVLCHGIPAGVKDPEDRGYPLLAERFAQEGFLVLIFNFRGAGSSEGSFDILGWVRDLEGGLALLVCRPEVDQKRLYLMGFSAGAAVSIYAAAHHREIAGLVSCASPAEFQGLNSRRELRELLDHARAIGMIKEEGFPPSVAEWEKGFEQMRPLDWVGQIPPRPFLLIQGTRDEVVDAVHARRLYERVRGKAELFLIEEAGHRLRTDPRAMEKALAWLKETDARSPA